MWSITILAVHIYNQAKFHETRITLQTNQSYFISDRNDNDYREKNIASVENYSTPLWVLHSSPNYCL